MAVNLTAGCGLGGCWLQIENDLAFEVEVKWEDPQKIERDLIKIPPGKSATVSTFVSHHLTFHKREVRSEGRCHGSCEGWNPLFYLSHPLA